jgi:hypothetical protein
LIDSLFGCSHQHTTFPITRGRKLPGAQIAASSRTYVVCLDCGREFDYNWQSMQVGRPVEVPPVAATAPLYR